MNQPQNQDQQKRLEELESAFAEFARMSEGLEASYQSLQGEVSELNEKLAAAHSERLKHLQEKEQIADQLERLLDALPGGVVVLDEAGTIQTANPAAQEFFEGALEGEQWESVLQRVRDQQTPALAKDLVLKNGRVLELSSSRPGKDSGEILLFSEVTETRKLQHHLDQNRRLASMGEMAASLAHQVRTPLAAALLYIGHLEKEALTDEKRLDVAGKLRSRLHHLNGLVNDMLHYARGGSPGDEEIAVVQFVEALQQTLEEEVRRAEARFLVELQIDDQAVVVGNRDALLTSLQNLVNNAIEAVGSGVAITCRVIGQTDGGVEFQIEDNGPGIDESTQQQIFEPFYTSRARGTGLGLAVVRAVADAHGGEVWVRSTVGEGAIFGMRLPGRREARAMDALQS